jgi:hypothetical protein
MQQRSATFVTINDVSSGHNIEEHNSKRMTVSKPNVVKRRRSPTGIQDQQVLTRLKCNKYIISQ